MQLLTFSKKIEESKRQIGICKEIDYRLAGPIPADLYFYPKKCYDKGASANLRIVAVVWAEIWVTSEKYFSFTKKVRSGLSNFAIALFKRIKI